MKYIFLLLKYFTIKKVKLIIEFVTSKLTEELYEGCLFFKFITYIIGLDFILLYSLKETNMYILPILLFMCIMYYRSGLKYYKELNLNRNTIIWLKEYCMLNI